ncbi:hypothetical protein ABH955_004124 [Bacillus sp. RC240]
MKTPVEFKWKHYQPDIILLTVRCYLRYSLSFRDLVEMMEERGLSIAHTTIMLSEVHTGTYVEPSKLLYGEYLESGFNTKKHSVGIQTARVLKGYLNSRIIPSLGNIKLAKLKHHCICKTTLIHCETKV